MRKALSTAAHSNSNDSDGPAASQSQTGRVPLTRCTTAPASTTCAEGHGGVARRSASRTLFARIFRSRGKSPDGSPASTSSLSQTNSEPHSHHAQQQQGDNNADLDKKTSVQRRKTYWPQPVGVSAALPLTQIVMEGMLTKLSAHKYWHTKVRSVIFPWMPL